MKQEKTIRLLIPIMLGFFVMGFVDLVGTATNYVKADLRLSDTMANLFPSMVFFWFLIFSVPTGMLMNRIGRRKTVLLSLFITILSLLLPVLGYSFTIMLISFSLLGIGNTLMQVSLNPLLSDVVSGHKLASSLTLGQFVKAIASFSAPFIARWGAMQFSNWKVLFPLFMAVAILSIILLGFTSIKESQELKKNTTMSQCFALLGNKVILLSFLGIMCHVGIDVGINVTAPKILSERLAMKVDDAVIATSVYFFFRLAGCLTGTFVLSKFSAKKFFGISVFLMIISVIGLFICKTLLPIYICMALIGFGNSNIFPIILSQAMLYMPEKRNEVSGLMMMGIFGGAVFPLLMGFMSDALKSQAGALIIISGCIMYLLLMTSKLKTEN